MFRLLRRADQIRPKHRSQNRNVWKDKKLEPTTYRETRDADPQRMERQETQALNVWKDQKLKPTTYGVERRAHFSSPTERDLRIGLRTLGPPKKPKQAPENKEALDTLSRIPNSSQTRQ